jgi:hypothetical protein
MFLSVLLAVSMSLSFGQSGDIPDFFDQQLSVSQTFNQEEFNGRFSVRVAPEGEFEFYVVDMTQFADRFERVYFINQTYTQAKLVNMDWTVDKEQYWFKAYNAYSEEEITGIFDELKKTTLEVSQSMTVSEKSSWLAAHDKFKK